MQNTEVTFDHINKESINITLYSTFHLFLHGDLNARDLVVLMDASQTTLYKLICFIHILFIMVE